jgi:hypothetical protein
MKRAPSTLPLLLTAAGGILTAPLVAADFVVTNEADAGPGSLRQAILASNTTPEADVITFSSTTAGGAINFHDGNSRLINLGSQLPAITGVTTLRGPTRLGVLRPTAATTNYRLMEVSAGATMVLSDVTLLRGRAAAGTNGGAILNAGSLTLTRVAVSENQVLGTAVGAGIFSSGSLTVDSCLLRFNSGGAIYVSAGTASLVNTTLARNQSPSGNTGGGVHNLGSLTLTNCTVSDHPRAGLSTSGPLTLQNTMVAGNNIGASPPIDIQGHVTVSNGANFVGTATGVTGLSSTDRTFASTGTDLAQLIGPIDFNGGNTWTFALVPGSPAINAGSNLAVAGIQADQRGFGARINGGTVDIGAYEFGAAAAVAEPGSLVVTMATDSVFGDGRTSLREAVTFANTLSGPRTIVFSKSTANGAVDFHDATPDTIDLADQLPAFTANTTIIGPGANKLTLRRPTASSTAFRLIMVEAAGTLHLSGCTLTGGSAPTPGGAIRNNGTLTLSQTTVMENTSQGAGGGLFNWGNLTVSQCLFQNNTSVSSVSSAMAIVLGTAQVSNTTFSDHTSGCIFNLAALTLTNCTISHNHSPAANSGGGIENGGALTLRNTIVAGNTNFFGTGVDVNGPVNSNGANFIGIPAGATGLSGTDQSFASTGTTLAQLIGPLTKNGGPTQTRALLPGSAAINAGRNVSAAALPADQRGYGPRITGGTVDIGAYEFGAAAPEPASLVVTSTSDTVTAFDYQTTLREAIALPNPFNEARTITFSSTTAGGAVDFHDGTTRVIDLSSQLPALTSQTTLSGPGAPRLIIQRPTTATTGFRLMEVAALADATISSLTLKGGQTSGAGAGILNGGTLTVNSCTMLGHASTGFGGGIANQGILTVNQTHMEGNTGARGGAVFNTGSAALSRCFIFENNAASEGGGIHNAGTLTLFQSQMSYNNVGSFGGGIYSGLNSTLTLYNSTVGNNVSSSMGGGGIYCELNTLAKIVNSSISENNALDGGDGGGILHSGQLTLAQSTIAENFATGTGGGIRGLSGSTTNVGNSIVAGNSRPSLLNDITGTITSNGANYFGVTTGTTGFLGSDLTFDTTQINNIGEVLNPLNNNGGPTDTNALVTNSPALNAGNPNDITNDQFDLDGDSNLSEPLPFDQRGHARNSGGNVDIGAYEFNPTTPLQTWRALHGLAADGTRDLANPSGDGVKNILKYAFNLAPNAGDLARPATTILPTGGTAGLPAISINNAKQLLITFLRRKTSSNAGITLIVETGPDLAALAPLSLASATIVSIDAVWERVTIIDPTAGTRRFARVRVTVSGP